MDRRSFLRAVGGLGSAALAAGAAAGCSNGNTPPAPPARSRQPAAPNWQDLADSLHGDLLRPADPGYAAAGHLYNALYTPQSAATALCQSASDVQRCIAFARRHGLELAAHSGGHSYAGYSTCSGLVIDVSRLDSVKTPGVGANAGSAAPQTATVGAGTNLIDVYSQLGAQGLLVPGGSCPTVGIAGLALGGGHGVFSRAYGLTCDQTLAVEIVSADGTLRRCAPGQDEDLYWACRGGGGGNFGVVTSFEFRTHAVPDAITLFTLDWPWGAAGAVFDAWTQWVPAAPAELWANCQLYSSGSAGSGVVKVTGVYVGSVTACSAALAPLESAVGAGTTSRFVGPEDYLTATMIEAGCEGESVSQCAVPVQSPFATKSSYIGGRLSEGSVTAIVAALSDLPTVIPGAGAGVVFDSYGGVINQIRTDDTAFVHRNALACAQYSVTYPNASPTAETRTAAHEWLTKIEDACAPVSQGSYQNYIDPTLDDWQQAYYGANLPRLREIKRTYDPDNVFRFAQSIPVA
jgi:FAD/FMN-containing dehydrogenase